MNAFSKRPLPEALPPGDPQPSSYAHARNEWDNRIMDAASSAKAWRMHALVVSGLLAFSVFVNWRQATSTKIVPYVIERDSLGNPIARRVNEDSDPTEREAAAAVMRWVRDVRTVYVDAAALKRSIMDVYALTEAGSPAKRDLDRFYQTNDPFNRAKIETAAVTRIVALPMGTAPDAAGLRTIRIEWDEVVTPRDDSSPTTKKTWVAAVTYRHTPPTTSDQIETNPDGVFVVDYKWQAD